MSEGWSIPEDGNWAWVKDRKDLIPSSGVTTHHDPRMHLSIKDIPNTGTPRKNEIELGKPLENLYKDSGA